jgi:hypothetical protein
MTGFLLVRRQSSAHQSGPATTKEKCLGVVGTLLGAGARPVCRHAAVIRSSGGSEPPPSVGLARAASAPGVGRSERHLVARAAYFLRHSRLSVMSQIDSLSSVRFVPLRASLG